MDKQPSLPELSDYPVIITLPILWGDQDAFGHVNNTLTIRWFESARIAYMEQGFPASMRSSEGAGPILAAIRCNYRRQLHYPAVTCADNQQLAPASYAAKLQNRTSSRGHRNNRTL